MISVTRRSRSDECDLLSEWVIVRTDLTDVTLVSDDTHGNEDLEDEGDEEDEKDKED